MQLEFTREQEELRDSVRSVLAKECPISLVREVVEKGTGADRVWARMVELDWPALTIAQEHGGLGLGFVELAVVVEELGRAVAPGPLLATVTQFAPVIRECGSDEQQAKFLSDVATGASTGAFSSGPGAPTLDAATADEIAVAHGGAVYVVPRREITVSPIEPLDRSRGYARVDLGGFLAGPERTLARPERLPRAVEEATVAVAIEIVGTCQAIFDIALEYAKEREQFGVPIGSFQAIKHKFADMYVALERARALAYFAAATIAEDDPRRTMGASMAKAAAGDCQRLIAQEGIQILGGIGYTWEHDMHLYVKRAKSGDALLGTGSEHRARVAELLGM